MIWLLLYFRSKYDAWTGLRTYDFSFACRACGAELPARVAAEGHAVVHGGMFGGAPDRERAHAIAERAAYAYASKALAWAPCPRCHEFSADAVAEVERHARSEARRASLRVPLALGVAAALLAGFALAALLLHRPVLTVSAAGVGAAAWGVVALALAPSTRAPRLAAPANVWFWTRATGPDLEPRWVAALEATPQAPARPPPRHAPGARLGGVATTLLAGGLAMAAAGVVLYFARTSHLHVANPGRADLTIRIDGAPAGVVHATPERGADIGGDSFALSRDAHVVEAVDARGAVVDRATVDLGQGDFLFAPGAGDGDACFAIEQLVYAKSWTQPIEEGPSVEPLPRGGVLWRLSAAPSLPSWEPPPTSLQLSNSESRRRVYLLRAFACPAKGEITPDSRPFARRG